MLLKRLTEHQVEFVLIGGYAAMTHGSPVVNIRHLEAIQRLKREHPNLFDAETKPPSAGSDRP